MATPLDVSRYFVRLSSPEWGDYLSNLKLQKLLYYAQGMHLALSGEPIFDEEIEAWDHGPVVPSMYQYFKGENSKSIPVDPEFDPLHCSLDKGQLDILKEVFDVYGQYSAWKLRNMTHSEAPWKSIFKEGVFNQVISKELIKDYFINVVLVDEDSPEYGFWLAYEIKEELKKNDSISKKVYKNVDSLFADI